MCAGSWGVLDSMDHWTTFPFKLGTPRLCFFDSAGPELF